MSKNERPSRNPSVGRGLTTSNFLPRKPKRGRRTNPESIRLHKSQLYYVPEEPSTRRGIIEKFLDFLLDIQGVKRETLLRKLHDEKSVNIVTTTHTEKDFKDIEDKDLKQATVITANGSKIVLDKTVSLEPHDPLSKSELFKTTNFVPSIKRQPSGIPSANRLPKLNESFGRRTFTSLEVIKGISEAHVALEDPVFIRIEKIYFPNGNIYEGPTNEYLIHGNGKFIWADNTSYKGDFKDGYITGKGETVLSDMTKYEGEFCNGFFHGNGFLNILNSPRCYYGEWKNGKKDGYGWMMYEPGNWYEGEWSNDLRHSKGLRKYKNGSKYSGEWVGNKKQGKGKILFCNDDATLPVQLKYYIKPGIMNFGTDCGATYAGTWRKNFKHGPGLMVCGNGLVLESNPLFEFNKGVHKKHQISLSELCEKNVDTDYGQFIENKCSYQGILQLVNSEIAHSDFDDHLLANITHNSKNIPEHMFVNSIDNATGWCPLYIPTHCITEDVNLEYFVDIIFTYHVDNLRSDDYVKFMSNIVKNPSRTCQNIDIEDCDINNTSLEEKLKLAKNRELKKIRNTIILYLPKLKIIYERYSTCYEYLSEEPDVKLKFKPVLVRIFLWQFFRDIQIPENGIQLVDIDELLWKNPESCLSTAHYPFEPIYFYQFLMYLMGCTWLTFLTKYSGKFKVLTDSEYSYPSKIFRDFLDKKLESIVMMKDTAMLDHLHTAPLQSMYKTYTSIGEPMTVKAFLNATCTKDGEDPPCYYAINALTKTPTTPSIGFNAVPIAHQIMYLHDSEPIFGRKIEETECREDKFYNTLYTFRVLGEKVILETISIICPTLGHIESSAMKYKITFLEFYEIVILLAYIKAENEMKKSQTATVKGSVAEVNYRQKIKRKKMK
uniref:Radial spoke head 10 homolog B-like n=1 Tax=Diabrotica virgifera virgifera TaxID=50390 RepID=A0A6P7G4J5_DIAVI